MLTTPTKSTSAVGVGRIEEGQTPIDRRLEGGFQLAVLAGVVAPEKLVAPGPGTHGDPRQVGRLCSWMRQRYALHEAQPPNMNDSSPGHSPPAQPAPPDPLAQPDQSTQPAPRRDQAREANEPDQANLSKILCHHCGRTASNGISCQGFCVADSNY
jgi:hypothetical protein